MANKKRTWKFWVSRTLLALLLIGGVWLTNLIWFRPYNIRHFYDRTFVKYALNSPEMITALSIPVLFDWTKTKLDDVSDGRLWKDFQQSKEDYATLLSYNLDKQSPANQLNTKILNAFMKSGIEGEPFFYHNYPVNQVSGVQRDLPISYFQRSQQ